MSVAIYMCGLPYDAVMVSFSEGQGPRIIPRTVYDANEGNTNPADTLARLLSDYDQMVIRGAG